VIRIPNVPRAAANLAGLGLRRAERRLRPAARALQRYARRARRQQEIVAQAPILLRARARQATAALERSRKRVLRFNDHVLAPYEVEWRVGRALARAAADGRPIVAGPWTSEVGYEALYWVPFLRWAADRYGVRPDRVIAISRGGTDAWYRDIAATYVDVFELVDPEEFARHLADRRDRGDQKQMTPSEFDRELVHLACSRAGIRDAVLWHPGLMYQLFRAFWHGDRSLDFLLRHTDFRRVQAAAGSARASDPALPADYVAVKFYTGPALPDTPGTRRALNRLVRRLAMRTPVVMLDTAWSADEHRDYVFDGMKDVITLRPSLDPRGNLGVQTRVIAGARAFVGTCGGLAWLAPLLGVDTLAVYDDDRYLAAHLYAARYIYRRMEAARFSTLNVQALGAVTAHLEPHTV
jgi:hypothetical protein